MSASDIVPYLQVLLVGIGFLAGIELGKAISFWKW